MMGLLENIGLSRKKPRPVGKSLEKGRSGTGRRQRRNVIWKGVIFVGLVLLTLAAFPRGNVFQYTVTVGDEWRRETLEAPFDFPVYKSDETLAQERRNVRRTTPPYFSYVADAQETIEANRDTVEFQLEQIFDAYASFRYNQTRGRPAEAADDSVRYMELRRNAWLKATPEQWAQLVDSYVNRMPGLSSTSREPDGEHLAEKLLRQASLLALELTTIGVMDIPEDSVLTGEITIRYEGDNTYSEISLEHVYGRNEAQDYVQQRFDEEYGRNSGVGNLGLAFFRSIFVPSLEYQRARSIAEWRRKQDRITPTRGKVSEGDIIVRRGQPITEETKRQLTSLEFEQQARGGETILWRVMLGQFLVTLATYIIFFLYLFLLRRQIFDDNRRVLLVALLFGGIVGLFAIAIRMPSVAMYAVPVAIAPVVLTVMFDSRVGLFGALALALIGGQLLDYNFEFTFATIFASTLGVFSVRDIKNRGQFFVSAGLVFVGYVVVIGATVVLYGLPRELFLSDLLLVAVNSFLLILAYPLLWVFERAFDITTDLSLLELSDTNRPLLKELSLRAAGTFNHSLQVANLAEAAADAIGANALLTRVGALYHDVGKMLKPEYFVENQRPAENPHNQLKPRMSALIIASHVKEGLEMGRQYNLPQRVLDFIPTHHGTTRIEYFYRKALEQKKDADPDILESEFRYPGPRPFTKETGILMLSDSVEAASRSLSDPTHKRLETLIDMIFKARIEDGQLDDTDLTFRDLNKIKDTFLNILLGIYHVRVKYPGQDEGGGAKASGAAREGPDGPGTRDATGEAPEEMRESAAGGQERSGRPRGGDVAPTPPPNDDGSGEDAEQDQAAEKASRGDDDLRPKEDGSQIIGDPNRRAQGDGAGKPPSEEARPEADSDEKPEDR